MVNFDKNSKDKSFEAPTPYNHGTPRMSGYNNNGGSGGSSSDGYGSSESSYGNSGGYDPSQNYGYGEYVQPEIYEDSYSGSGYDGFRSPQPQTQRQYDDRGFAKNPGYGGSTGYADPNQQYSNQRFETMGQGQNSPFPNQSFDPQMNNGAAYNQGQPQPNVMPNYGMGQPQPNMQAQKFCKWCASGVAYDAVICPKCGRQIEELKQANPNMGMGYGQPQVVINNNNNNNNMVAPNPYGYVPAYGLKDKGVALLLSLFFGWFGAHKFYEGKILMGLIYLFTGGLFGIGNIIDFIILLGKPRKYLP